MRLDLTSLMFNMNISSGGGTPSWGTAMGQGADHKFNVEGYEPLLAGMVFKRISDITNVYCPLGKGGARQDDYDYTLAAKFDKVFVNGKRVIDSSFVLLIVTQLVASAEAQQHIGRKQLKYNPKITYNGLNYNEDCYKKMADTLGLNENSAWFVSDIYVKNQDELYFKAVIANKDKSIDFNDSKERKDYCMGLATTSKAKGGYNKIYYGAPGCGKSFFVDNVVLKEAGIEQNDSDNRRFRTTFHPDFANSDFVGQIMPKVEDDKVTYIFNPGPFALALKRAYQTEKMVYLVVEEINRGNASAIFGDLFQLLDRVKDSSKDNYGESEYEITNVNLQEFLSKELGMEFNSIKIPTNLTILATMNSSDQNVFTLDTAFKRRWAFEQISNDIDADTGHPYKNWFIPGSNITWAKFLKKINEKILEFKISNSSSEDKRLGKYFVTKDCLTETAKVIGDCEAEANNFAYKVLEYLWNDVCKLNPEAMFDISKNQTLEDLIEDFKKEQLNVFPNIDFNA